jgi:argininosuccinate synthase
MIPGVEIITPIRDLKLSREAEIEYLKEKGVEMNFEKAMYSQSTKDCGAPALAEKKPFSQKVCCPKKHGLHR